VQRLLRDRASTEPGHDVVDARGKSREREPHVLPDDPAEPDGERLLHDDHPRRAPECGAHLGKRIGPEALDPHRADPHPLLAQLVDDLFDRPEH
jgi:hypothetical protein